MAKLKMYSKVVTPEQAQEWLDQDKRPVNRNIHPRRVNFYYLQMVRGEWEETGDTIKFDNKGNLLDGQARLSAVVKYGKPVEFWIAEGLHNGAYHKLDIGKTRNAGDLLHMEGFTNVYTTVAMVRLIIAYEERSNPYAFSRMGYQEDPRFFHTSVLAFAKEHPEIPEHITATSPMYYKKFHVVSHSLLSAIHYIFSQKNKTLADEFFEKLENGVNLAATSPVRYLRERLIRDVHNKTRLTNAEYMALFIMAWNYVRKGTRINGLALGKNWKVEKAI